MGHASGSPALSGRGPGLGAPWHRSYLCFSGKTAPVSIAELDQQQAAFSLLWPPFPDAHIF